MKMLRDLLHRTLSLQCREVDRKRYRLLGGRGPRPATAAVSGYLLEPPPEALGRPASRGRRAPPCGEWDEGNARLGVALPSSFLTTTSEKEELVAKVMIGVDPHKQSNAVVVINGKGQVLARRQVRKDRRWIP